MNTLSRGIVSRVTKLFKEKLPEHRKPELKANLKRNFYFPLSAILFFYLNSTSELGYSIGILIASIAFIVITSQIPSVFALMKQVPARLHALTAVTSLGICWYTQDILYKDLYMDDMLSAAFYRFLSISETAFMAFFIYFCVLIFWKEMTRIFSESNIFRDINKAEAIVYGVLIIASLAYKVVLMETSTQAAIFRYINSNTYENGGISNVLNS